MENKGLKGLIFKILPAYGWISIIVMLSVNMVTYVGTRFFTKDFVHYDMSLGIDGKIPLVPWFIFVYVVLAYAQWIIGYFLTARQERSICINIIVAEVIAKLICLFCFLVIPTSMVRPEITATDFWSRMVNLVYMIDEPNNLFPSIHCLESYVLLRSMPYIKAPKWYKYLTLPVTLLVFLSTLLVRQHVVLDIVGAMGAVESGILITRYLFKKKPFKALLKKA